MSTADNEFITQFMAAWNAHDVHTVTGYYATDYEDVDVARTQSRYGADTVRHTLLYYLSAFPDFAVTLDDAVLNGERIALYWTWTGTQRGTFMNIPPTGHRVRVRGSSLVTLRDGQIQRAVRIWDLAGLLRDLKLLPELTG